MSNAGRFHDYQPKIRPAGYVTTIKDETAAKCIKPAPPPNPNSPSSIAKYRKSHMQQVGTTIMHYGKVDDPLPPTPHVYGLESKPSDHVLGCLTDKNTSG